MKLRQRITEDDIFMVRFYFWWSLLWMPLTALSSGTFWWWEHNLFLTIFTALSAAFMFRVWVISGDVLRQRKFEVSHGEDHEGGTTKQE